MADAEALQMEEVRTLPSASVDSLMSGWYISQWLWLALDSCGGDLQQIYVQLACLHIQPVACLMFCSTGVRARHAVPWGALAFTKAG